MKRLIASLTIFALILSCCPALSLQARAAEEGIYEYEIIDGTACITDCDSNISGEIIIPSTLGGCPVTRIDDWAFYYCEEVTSVVIPDSVQTIGESAFQNCSGMTSVTFGSNITSIGESAFQGCTSLLSVTLPEKLTSVQDWMFEECDALVSVTVGNDVTYIGEYAFARCDNLTTVNLGNNVTHIGHDAFYESDKLTYNTYDNAYYLGNEAAPYTVLVKATDTSITGCQIHPDTNLIYQEAFDFCEALTSITIPEGVVTIGSYAFSSCGALQSVNIPASVQSIGEMAFQSTHSLTGFHVDENNPNYSSDATGSLFDKDKTTLLQVPGATSGTYTIPDTVQYVGDDSFNGCCFLTRVEIPDGVTTIGNSVFVNCHDLTSISIPASVTSIGYSFIAWCAELKEIRVAEENPNYSSDDWGVLFNKDKSVLMLAPTAISGAYHIPDSVTSIENSAFQSCQQLNSVTIPNSVTTIGELAFHDCYGLTFVTVPDSVQSLGRNAFGYCGSLKAVRLSNSITALEQRAFSGCRRLQHINIPTTVTSIDFGVFQDCSMLSDVYYPGTEAQWAQIEISNYNEYLMDATIHYQTEMPDFSQLTFAPEQPEEPDYPDDPEYPEEEDALLENGYYYIVADEEAIIVGYEETLSGDIVIPDTLGGYPVTVIGNSAFEGAALLTGVTIPDSVTVIENWAFYCCPMTSITLGSSLTTIGEYAFYWSGLTELTLPASVTNIGSFAFSECYNLTAFYVDEANPCFSSEKGVLFNKDKSLLVTAPCALSGSYTVPDNVTTIGQSAFTGCSAMTQVVIPDSVTSIDAYAFSRCYALTSVALSANVTSIGDQAFSQCDALTGIFVDENNPCYSSDDFGVLFDKKKTELLQAPGGITGSYTVPDSVESIFGFAFECCYNLTAVTIADSVTHLGEYAFSDCYALSTVDIGNGVTTIPSCAFAWCKNLIAVNIGTGTRTIEEGAFSECHSLQTIGIGNQVNSIGDYVFYEVPLLDVYFTGTEEQWAAMYIGEGNESLYNATVHFAQELPELPDAPEIPDTPDVPDEPDVPDVPRDLGDLDGVPGVSEDDAIYLLQAVLMPDFFPLNQNADYDGNGELNEDDAIYLLQHVLMPDFFPLTPPEAESGAVMTHREYMAAALDTPVTVECYVQATQEWWNDTVIVYAQDHDGGYFIYDMACSEADAAKLTPGTKIRVSGYKAEWAGEIEIMDGKFEFVDDGTTFVAEPLDVTQLLGSDDLIQHQNKKVSFKGMTIEAIEYKNGEPGDDIYVTVTKDDGAYLFCVERYLTGPDTDVYQAFAALKEGDVVDIEGFLYWYEGVYTHITAVSKTA